MKKENYTLLRAALAALVVGGFAASGHATLITYDGFDYTSGDSLEGQNGGSGWGSSWDNQEASSPPPHAYVIGSSGLSYGSLVVEGNRGRHATSFDNTGRRLDTAGGGAWDTAGFMSDAWVAGQIDQGNVWGSVLLQRDAATASWEGGPEFVLHRNNTHWFYNTGSASLQLNWDAGSSTWRARVASGSWVNLSSSALGDPVLFVFKLELSPSGSNNIYVWQNPTGLGGSDPSVSSADASFTSLTSSDSRFKAVAFYGGGSVSNATSMDEIRFGTSFASVTPIPEPSTYALLILGAAGLVLLRKRANRR